MAMRGEAYASCMCQNEAHATPHMNILVPAQPSQALSYFCPPQGDQVEIIIITRDGVKKDTLQLKLD